MNLITADVTYKMKLGNEIYAQDDSLIVGNMAIIMDYDSGRGTLIKMDDREPVWHKCDVMLLVKGRQIKDGQ